MSEKDATYDGIGSAYEDYASGATLKRAESYSVLEMVGDLTSVDVLDLACGTGFYTRLLREKGAESVLGVDLSAEMARVARQHEAEAPLGVTYQVTDAQHLGVLGSFNLVTAVWLLNYAESRAQLRSMAESAYANLAPGGRFVAFTINPSFDYRISTSQKYGVRVIGEDVEDDHFVCHGEFVVDPPARVDVRRFSREVYEEELRAAGFSRVDWRAAGVSTTDLEHYGAEYWRDFLENCIGIGIVAQK